MAITDHGFDGSAVVFGTVPAAPLTDYRHMNQPATVRQTGSTDTAHSYGVGRNNQTLTIGVMGSLVPDAGISAALAVTLNASQETLSIASVAVTNISITGRKDGEIRSNLTLRPSAITPATFSSTTRKNIGFDGTVVTAGTYVFGSSTGAGGLVSASYQASCAEVDDAGSGDSDVIISPGIPDRTYTWEAIGGPSTGLTKGTTFSLTSAWNDGGTLGTFTSAVITGVEDGGTLDDVVTSQYTAKQYLGST